MVFDEVIAKSYEQINCFKLLAVLLALVMLLLGNIFFIEPLMASLTFYSGHVGCLISPMDMAAMLDNTSTKYFREPFLKSGSSVDISSGVNFFREVSLSLLAVLLIQSWRKVTNKKASRIEKH